MAGGQSWFRKLFGLKHIVEFFVVSFIAALFLFGLYFASPTPDDPSNYPPPPIWSRGSNKPIKLSNDSTTEGFNLLLSSGFRPVGILEVGAYNGKWSRQAQRFFPDAEIFLIEASENRREDLQKTGFSYMIVTAGSKVQIVDFYDIPGKKGNSRFREQTEDFVSDTPIKKVTYPLDMLMEGMPSINLLKLDVRGSELEILNGAIELLKQVEVLYITVPLMKLHQGAPLALAILSFAKDKGFELLNYVDGESRGPHDALVHIELTLAKKDSPLFVKVSDGIVLQEDQIQEGEDERG